MLKIDHEWEVGESGQKQKDLEDLQARDGGRFDSNGSREVRFSGMF